MELCGSHGRRRAVGRNQLSHHGVEAGFGTLSDRGNAGLRRPHRRVQFSMGLDDGLVGRPVSGEERSGHEGSTSQHMIRRLVPSFDSGSPELKITTHPPLLPNRSWPEQGFDTMLLAPAHSAHWAATSSPGVFRRRRYHRRSAIPLHDSTF